jgi:hypothetical protein
VSRIQGPSCDADRRCIYDAQQYDAILSIGRLAFLLSLSGFFEIVRGQAPAYLQQISFVHSYAMWVLSIY